MWGETIHNLRVNHTIKNGFGISRQESVVIIINTIDKKPIKILLLRFKNPAAIVIGATINIENGLVKILERPILDIECKGGFPRIFCFIYTF